MNGDNRRLSNVKTLPVWGVLTIIYGLIVSISMILLWHCLPGTSLIVTASRELQALPLVETQHIVQSLQIQNSPFNKIIIVSRMKTVLQVKNTGHCFQRPPLPPRYWSQGDCMRGSKWFRQRFWGPFRSDNLGETLQGKGSPEHQRIINNTNNNKNNNIAQHQSFYRNSVNVPRSCTWIICLD